MNDSRNRRLAEFLLAGIAFIVSIYTASNLMPLVLHAAVKGLNLAGGLSIIGYLLAGTGAMVILARAIYRLDNRAGRIRNRVGWFE